MASPRRALKLQMRGLWSFRSFYQSRLQARWPVPTLGADPEPLCASPFPARCCHLLPANTAGPSRPRLRPAPARRRLRSRFPAGCPRFSRRTLRCVGAAAGVRSRQAPKYTLWGRSEGWGLEGCVQ